MALEITDTTASPLASTEETAALLRTDHMLISELINQLETVDITAIALMRKRRSRERMMSDMDHE